MQVRRRRREGQVEPSDLLPGSGRYRRVGALAGRALLDALYGIGDGHQALDEDSGRVDAVRIDLARLNEVLDFRHGDPGRRGHHRVEVAGRLPVDEVALGVALPGMNDGDISKQPTLHHVPLAVEFPNLLAVCNDGPDARSREEGRNAGAPGADALGECPLRIELELELAREVLLGEELVLPDIGRDHLPDLPGLEQEAQARSVHAGVVRDEGEIFRPRIADGEDQRFRYAAQAEASGHDRHAVPDEFGQCRSGVWINLVHAALPQASIASPTLFRGTGAPRARRLNLDKPCG